MKDICILARATWPGCAQVVEAQAKSYGCTGDVDWMDAQEPMYPPTINDPGAFKFSKGMAIRHDAHMLLFSAAIACRCEHCSTCL